MYNSKLGKTCVIYIRVSSERQVKGYSLEGQKRYLEEYAERQGMKVLFVYVEEGKSGKSIEGRTAFQKMLDEIKRRTLKTDYVIVYKLSRFGRNAKDVLNSLEFIMQYGVYLMCAEDGLDSSTAMGKMMITILGALAELERENIITQSLLGREEKAKSGGWNGGFAPYGYMLKDSRLVPRDGQKEIVIMIFDMYLNKEMGYSTIASYFNRNGYTREPAPNAVNPKFTDWRADQIKRILDNPLYTGKIAWGRRRTEKIQGTDNEYRLVPQKEYTMSEVQSHEPLVSEADFEKVQALRELSKKKSWGNHNISQERAHLLSGIARCPQCGSAMNADCNQWTNKDGTKRERFAYVCGHYKRARGTKQCRRNGISANVLEKEVLEYTKKLLRNQKFARDIKERIGVAVDITQIQEEICSHEKELKKLARNRLNLEQDIDNLQDDKYAERKRNEFNRRLNKVYDKIYDTEDMIESCKKRMLIAEQESMNIDAIYQILMSFDKIYDKMNDRDKRELIKCMIKEIKLYMPEEQKQEGHAVKSIVYSFPIEEDVIQALRVKETHVETVVLLSHKKPDSVINVKVEFGEGEGKVPLKEISERAEAYNPKERVTYKIIKEYIEAKYGFKVHTAYIAEVKRDLGLPMYDAPNVVEELKQPRKHPTAEKVEAIKDALKYFGII